MARRELSQTLEWSEKAITAILTEHSNLSYKDEEMVKVIASLLSAIAHQAELIESELELCHDVIKMQAKQIDANAT